MSTELDIAQSYGGKEITTPSVSPIDAIAQKYGGTVLSTPVDNSKTITDWTGIQNPTTYFKDALTQAGDFIMHPIKAVESAVGAGVDAVGSAFSGAYQANKKVAGDVNGPGTWAQKTADVLHSIGTDAAVLFSPISAAFAAASKLPVLKEAADVLTLPFAVTGKVGDFAAESFIKVLPIDQASKDVLAPAFGEVGALAGQILLGGKIMDIVSRGIVPDKAVVDKAVLETKTETAIAEQHAQSPETIAQKYGGVMTPQEKLAQYSKSQGYEPYTPPAELPTIDVGKASNGLPTIQTEARPSTKMGSLTVEPIKSEPTTVSTEAPKAISVPNVASKSPVSSTDITPRISTDVAQTAIDRPILDNGMRVAKAANDINEQLVTKGIEQLPPEEQAKYTPQTKVDQVKKVADIMTRDMEGARQMIRGEKPIPEGVQHQVLFNAMEEHAIRNGDAVLLRDLAKSPIATKLSEAAQALGAHGYSDNPNSPVEAIRSIEKASKKSVKTKNEAKVKDLQNLKSEVKSIKPKKQSWVEFIRSVKC